MSEQPHPRMLKAVTSAYGTVSEGDRTEIALQAQRLIAEYHKKAGLLDTNDVLEGASMWVLEMWARRSKGDLPWTGKDQPITLNRQRRRALLKPKYRKRLPKK